MLSYLLQCIFSLVIGPSAYKLLLSLLLPHKPGDLKYKDLVNTKKKHYNLVLSDIAQRYKFHKCFWKLSKSVATYVSELRSIGEYCNFDTTLDAMLCHWLVCGVRDDVIHQWLLAEPDLKFTKAFELA